MGETLNAMAAISVFTGVILGGVVYGWRTVARKMNGGDPVVAKLAEVVTAIETQDESAGRRHRDLMGKFDEQGKQMSSIQGFMQGAKK